MPDEDRGFLDETGQEAARGFGHTEFEVAETTALEDSEV
jgi:hypothetical protein